MSFLSKIFGDANERFVKSLLPVVEKINSLEEDFKKLSQEELRNKTIEFRKRLEDGETLDELLPEAFTAVREASRRTLGQRHYDVQLIGGIVLHKGNIAEMRTGEGKTLVATLPSYLNALAGKGVHVVTVNDYLARRDSAWMGQIYNALGMSVGCINHDQSYLYDSTHQELNDPLDKEEDKTGAFKIVHEFLRPVEKKEAYDADITYGTNNEYGFDYLRDNMVFDKNSMVQRQGDKESSGHSFAIIDEVDSILIDEARTPLIISAPDMDSTKLYDVFAKIVPKLNLNEDYTVDEKRKAVSINDSGIEKVEKSLGIENIYDEGGVKYVHQLEQALTAHAIYKKDRHYVVKDDQVIIVDEFTGRLMPGRRWSDGLHQAVEAKEGVTIQKESKTLATITFQNYFRLYKKIGGMTGTGRSSAEEFHKVYNLNVVSIPTNKDMVRQDLGDRIYKTESGKFKAVVERVKELQQIGQPVLLGTASIEKNEILSTMLEHAGVPHNVLNAKNHEREAEIIAQAGRPGAVTVATNMAGRGVDIILGGNPPDSEDAKKVKELGGLFVVGTERHEARRIDDQLRGRSGRQGDPGVSQFYLSTEDDLVRVFGGDRMKNMMETIGVGDEDVIENSFISRAISQAQAKVEGHFFDARKLVLEYDDVMNKHRESIYGLRREALFSDSLKERTLESIRQVIKNASLHFSSLSHNYLEGEDPAVEFALSFESLVSDGSNDNKIIDKGLISEKAKEFLASNDLVGLEDYLFEIAKDVYEKRESGMGHDAMRYLEKGIMLKVIDELWVEHIDTMQHLQNSVQLRAYGQRDPLVEYKNEGQGLFETLKATVFAQVANLIFKVKLIKNPEPIKTQELRPDPSGRELGSNQINEPAHRDNTSGDHKELGRNDPCWCGSGKKFKKCHGE